jgi:hypothetical protein
MRAMGLSYNGGPILSLDQAIKTGVCFGEPGATPELETVNFGGRDHDDEFDIWARAQIWLIRRIADCRPALITLEGLVPKWDKTIQCGIYSVFGGIARNKSIPIMVTSVQAWRLHVLGDGKLKKEIAKARAVALCGQLGWAPDGHDEAEAACQWLYACSRVAPRLVPRIPLFLRGAA